eukprot:1303997-Pyramimonas_sp.AAC.1
MAKKLHKLGWKVVAQAAEPTLADDASSGVIVADRSHLGLSQLTCEAGEWTTAGTARWLLCTLRLRK